MSNAEKFVPRYTVKDYQTWQGDWELWQGHAVSMSPSPFAKHSKLMIKLGRVFGNALETSDQCRDSVNVYGELDWIISENTVVRPDLSIVCGEVETHIKSPPAIVVEILSASTRDRDLNYKRSLYQAQSVPYYLIADPDARTVLQLHLEDGEYRDISASPTASFKICQNCNFEISLAEVFD